MSAKYCYAVNVTEAFAIRCEFKVQMLKAAVCSIILTNQHHIAF